MTKEVGELVKVHDRDGATDGHWKMKAKALRIRSKRKKIGYSTSSTEEVEEGRTAFLQKKKIDEQSGTMERRSACVTESTKKSRATGNEMGT